MHYLQKKEWRFLFDNRNGGFPILVIPAILLAHHALSTFDSQFVAKLTRQLRRTFEDPCAV
jgi:hypothetical protein